MLRYCSHSFRAIFSPVRHLPGAPALEAHRSLPSCSLALPLILTSRAVPAGSHRVVCRIRTGMASPRGGFSKHCSEKQPVLVWCSSQGGWRRHWGIGMGEADILKYLVATVRSFYPQQAAMGKEEKKGHLLGSCYFSIHTDSAHPQMDAMILILQMSSLRLRN